ncbi:MAG: hypothetical protein BWY09_02589 [Candidatus Hydrogenedentes bacterium ADurb.Bin179]|nr:MAG: hypothetical protein BWY09_02589 [Candidatus Hydrogenedentes bacterium ADurb.Bin179]
MVNVLKSKKSLAATQWCFTWERTGKHVTMLREQGMVPVCHVHLAYRATRKGELAIDEDLALSPSPPDYVQ